MVQQFLAKLAGLDKKLKIIQRKVLKGTPLPVTIQEIQADNWSNPYFKDIYLYIAQNKCFFLQR